MRQISVSVEVFSRIWALRREGEDSENEILARVLSEPLSSKQDTYREFKNAPDGVRDLRHGVHFPEGFAIFRTFKGEAVQAMASDGVWVTQGATYTSLNELSRGIGAGVENAWANWFFLGDDGRRKPVASLRDPAAVTRRPQKPMRKTASKARASKLTTRETAPHEVTWLDDVRAGLASLEDGRGLLRDIYNAVEKRRRDAGRPWPADAEALVLSALEENASDNSAYRGEADLFHMPYGPGAGFWALR